MKTSEIDLKTIIQKALDHSIDYDEYRKAHARRVANYIPSPTGEKPDLEYYAKLNDQRMKRLDKKAVVTDEIKEQLDKLDKKLIWLVITEDWCGDAAQIVPYIAAMATQSTMIDLRLIYRDENPEVMDHFLTNGARSIPKLVIIDATSFEVLADWGPRPEEAQNLRMELKERNEPMEEVATTLQKWYTQDKGGNIQKEIMELLK